MNKTAAMACIILFFLASPLLHAEDGAKPASQKSADVPVLRAKDVFAYGQVILFNDDFASGRFAKWRFSENDNYQIKEPNPDRIKIVDAAGLQAGRKAVRFAVGAPPPNSFRSEISLPSEAGFLERWYAERIYVPAEWVIDPDRGNDIVMQWHAIPGNGRPTHPNLEISIGNTSWYVRQSFGAAKARQTRTNMKLEEPVKVGAWVSWVVHAKWSPGDDGVLQIWRDGKIVVDRKGPNVYSDIGVEYTPYLKTGIYHPEWHLDTDEKRTAFEKDKSVAMSKTICVTDVKVGSERATFDDVAPKPFDAAGKIRVACIGDSVTAGARLEDAAKDSYPARLQALLGDGYNVTNLGVGSCTLIRKGTPNVWTTLKEIQTRNLNPDLVIVDLGINDTCGGKRKCWDHKSDFPGDYRDLIDALRALPSKPRIWICAPSPMNLDMPGMTEAHKKDLAERSPRLRELIGVINQIAKERDVELIDLNSPLLGKLELFTDDAVHPNKAGCQAIAELVFKALPKSAVVPAATNPSAGQVAVVDGVIHCFQDNAQDGIVTHWQVPGQKVWVDAILRTGKIRQIRVNCEVTKKQTEIKLYWPEIQDGTITWNMRVTRQGDVVSMLFPDRGELIGDLMDVNEDKATVEALRKKLGLKSGSDSKLPMLYSSGDSISLCYWPYLEAELNNQVNVYYQSELAKDLPEVKLVNNGRADLAYGVLETAYKNERFKPDFVMVNFGLHMIATHRSKVGEYGKWIEKFDDLAKQHHAQLIWVTTTPYSQSLRPLDNPVIISFNNTAKKIAAERNIPVVDLYACTLDAVKELGDGNVYLDGIHFQDEVRKRQAACIAARMREIVQGKKPSQ